MNQLYYGDNLEIMRKHIQDECVDLIYLDPPFNSRRAYNIIFKDEKGRQASSQIEAFEDTWRWTPLTAQAFDELMSSHLVSPQLKTTINAFKSFMKTSDLMAYLTMMTIRLVEMHRVLKDTGSLYLHCDPTASHYLKILLDQIFGQQNFRNEIIWKRTSSHGNVQKKFGAIHDTIFFYCKGRGSIWNQIFTPFDESYHQTYYGRKDKDGRRYTLDNITAPMQRASKGQIYEWKDYKPGPSRCWIYAIDKMRELDEAGRLYYTKTGGVRYIRYLDEMEGVKAQDIWIDIKPVPSNEALGYPTQKPVALLERIIQASSEEGQTVLDPFCGCGTAIVAAEKLGRSWIGIDITYYAIGLVKKRLSDQFPDISFVEMGIPKSFDDAAHLARVKPFQFESWAVSLIGAQPFKSSGGGDTGVDGLLFFKDYEEGHHRIVVEVKGGGNQPKDIRALKQVMDRDKAPLGIIIALKEPTKGMIAEAADLGFWKLPGGKVQYPVLQIYTIQNYFDGKHPHLPDTSGTLKEAKRLIREREKHPKLPGME
jgi:DNA modification methylase